MPPSTDPTGGHWVARTQTDVTSLLLELARALRGFSFYSETAPERRPLADRAFRALSGELSRGGVIELHLDNHGFAVSGLPQAIEASGVLASLESAFATHGLHSIRFDPSLSKDALHGFFDLLGQPKDRFESPECFVRSLSARNANGIQLNGIDNQGPTAPQKLITTPPRASLATSPNKAYEEPSKPTLETHPLDVRSADERGERLRARLIELDQTADDDAYRDRARDITVWAQGLFEDALLDDCYRALLVLADHSVGSGGRPETQARFAAICFSQLANGERLDDLIRRATGSNETGVRAAQLLLQLGASAAPAVFDSICQEGRSEQAAPLHSLILALGDESLPTLIKAVESEQDQRAEIGIQLAGELQNPAVLPTLVRALRKAEPPRIEAIIQALSFLPGKEAKQAHALACMHSPRTPA